MYQGTSSHKTITEELYPRQVNATFDSQPTGLKLQVNGTTFTAPQTFVSWEGYKLNVNAPYPQTLAGTTYVFASWSDGRAQSHSLVTGAEPRTYTATYTACTITGSSGDDVLNGTSAEDVICGLGSNGILKGLGGNDTIEGIGGNDELRGGSGAEKVKGGAGADKLYGEDGNDTVNSKDGINGNDSLNGGAGTDNKVTDATEASILGFP